MLRIVFLVAVWKNIEILRVYFLTDVYKMWSSDICTYLLGNLGDLFKHQAVAQSSKLCLVFKNLGFYLPRTALINQASDFYLVFKEVCALYLKILCLVFKELSLVKE